MISLLTLHVLNFLFTFIHKLVDCCAVGRGVHLACGRSGVQILIPISNAELSFVPNILLCVGLWSRFLKFFEMLSLNANFAIIYPYYIPNIYLPVLKTQHHNEILDSLNRIKNKFTIYLTDLYSKWVNRYQQCNILTNYNHRIRFYGYLFCICFN